MRKASVLFSVMVIIGCVASACARNKVERVDPRPVRLEFDSRAAAYTKKVAVFPGGTGRWAIDADLQANYFDRFIQALQARSVDAQWVTPGQDRFPGYALQWAARDAGRAAIETARQAQAQGYTALLSTMVADVRTHEKTSGFWFFRKTKYAVSVAVSLDILDPFTAAKSAAVIKQDQRRVTVSDYDLIKERQYAQARFLQDMIQELTVKLAEQAAAEIKRLRWQAAVTQVDGDRISLAVGSRQGLSIGDHLAIFEGVTVAGYQDREYVAPGFQTGRVRIVAVEDDSASALIVGAAEIRLGDIAVAGD